MFVLPKVERIESRIVSLLQEVDELREKITPFNHAKDVASSLVAAVEASRLELLGCGLEKSDLQDYAIALYVAACGDRPSNFSQADDSEELLLLQTEKEEILSQLSSMKIAIADLEKERDYLLAESEKVESLESAIANFKKETEGYREQFYNAQSLVEQLQAEKEKLIQSIRCLEEKNEELELLTDESEQDLIVESIHQEINTDEEPVGENQNSTEDAETRFAKHGKILAIGDIVTVPSGGVGKVTAIDSEGITVEQNLNRQPVIGKYQRDDLMWLSSLPQENNAEEETKKDLFDFGRGDAKKIRERMESITWQQIIDFCDRSPEKIEKAIKSLNQGRNAIKKELYERINQLIVDALTETGDEELLAIAPEANRIAVQAIIDGASDESVVVAGEIEVTSSPVELTEGAGIESQIEMLRRCEASSVVLNHLTWEKMLEVFGQAGIVNLASLEVPQHLESVKGEVAERLPQMLCDYMKFNEIESWIPGWIIEKANQIVLASQTYKKGDRVTSDGEVYEVICFDGESSWLDVIKVSNQQRTSLHASEVDSPASEALIPF